MEKVLNMEEIKANLMADYLAEVNKVLDEWSPEREVLNESHYINLAGYEQTGNYWIASQCLYRCLNGICLYSFQKRNGNPLERDYNLFWDKTVEALKKI